MEGMPWSRLPKRVLYGVLMVKDKVKGNPSTFKACVKRDLLAFGLAEKGPNGDVDLEHWRPRTKSHAIWKELVAEKRDDTFMPNFYAKEVELHDKRALKKQQANSGSV
jgi:hypothetical protein